MEGANLLVTYDPAHPGKANEEVKALLEEHGGADFLDSDVSGVFLLRVREDAKKLVRKLRAQWKSEPERFANTFHWIPIEEWASSGVGEMEELMKDINNRIGDDDRWRITINKRHYDKHDTPELIEKLTAHIDKKHVDLKNPQKIVQVEIIGSRAGVSLLDAEECLDTQKR